MRSPTVSISMNDDRSKLSIRVQAQYSSGGHEAVHYVTRDGFEATVVSVGISNPPPGAVTTCVMQTIDKTIDIDGPFASQVTVNKPDGSTQVV